MESSIATESRGWSCARRNDFPEGYLLWMPPLFFAFDDAPKPASAPIWLLAVLLASASFWAAGRGRAEGWIETLFACGWIGVWSVGSGLLILHRGLGWPWAALGLASGAAVLAWSWICRRRRRPLEAAAAECRSALVGVDSAVWLVCGALLLFLTGESLLWADAAVFALTLLLYLLLTPRGRAAKPSEVR